MCFTDCQGAKRTCNKNKLFNRKKACEIKSTSKNTVSKLSCDAFYRLSSCKIYLHRK